MKPNFPPSPEDRLLDELLQELQQGPDETYLQQIEAAVDESSIPSDKRRNRGSFIRFSIAAAVVLTAGAVVWRQERTATQVSMAHEPLIAQPSAERAQMAMELKSFDKAVGEGEDSVEESRELLAVPAETKGVVQPGNNYFHAPTARDEGFLPPGDPAVNEESSRRDHYSKDSVDAKRDLQPDPELMRGVKLKQSELNANVGRTPAAEPELMTKNLESSRPARPRISPAPSGSDSSRIGDRAGGLMLPAEDKPAAQNFGDRYGTFIDQPWKSSSSEPLSTFSIDVDTASYGNVRRMIREGREVPRDAVRIEECINAFSYNYATPKGEGAFAVGASLAVCPWAPANQLVRVAIKGREIDASKRPASNLVFLIDVSGSMQSPDKLPLLKQSMATLVDQLDERDRVAIVVYAGSEGVALPSTRLDAEGRASVLATLSKLEAGGSTNGGAGIKRAYEIAMKEKIAGGVNRVILATDGDFNVGVTGKESLVELVKERAGNGVYLTVLGYGTGNLNDAMMDAITRDGNGNYFYIDSEREGRKVFLRNLAGTLVTIAKDVKIQVEFNPAKVGSYRLIGYANRVLRNEDFNNDKIDAGDIGAGHTVTAFYELSPPGAGTDGLKYQHNLEKPAASDEWMTLKLRHKHPDGDESTKIEFPLTGNAVALDQADIDFQFATAVALFGMKLRGMEEVREIAWEKVISLAAPGLADDAAEDRAEFVSLAKKLAGSREGIVPAPAEIVPTGGRR